MAGRWQKVGKARLFEVAFREISLSILQCLPHAACRVAILFVFLSATSADVVFDANNRCFIVAGYPEERPATLDDVLEADKKSGNRLVEYDPANDVYIIKAGLWIGTNTDWGTFFQIGRSNHPSETLILHGDLTVVPARPMGRRVENWRDYAGGRYDGRYRVSNRLVLGLSNQPHIKPVLKIACTRRGEFAVRVLSDPVPADPKDRWYVPIGEFYMFNALLTAADTNCPFAANIALIPSGANYCFRNSTIRCWSGSLFTTVFIATRGLTEEDRILRGMNFENGGSAAGPFYAVDCIFRNIEVARLDQGALRCVFENNRKNCELTTMHTGIELIDCRLGPQHDPLKVPRSARDEQWLRNYSVYRQYSDLALVKNPGWLERISLPVKVEDSRSGAPIPEATVIVDCLTDSENLAVVRGLAVTDREGMTPEKADDKALVITTRELRPTADPLRPEEITHRYRLQVQAKGYAEFAYELNTANDVPSPLILKLIKK